MQVLVLLVLSAAPNPVKQVPEGGAPIPVVDQGVVCGPVEQGWELLEDGKTIRPPAKGAEGAARTLDLKVAGQAELCTSSKWTVTVIATGPFPRIDNAGTTFYPDDGRLDLKGAQLDGVSIAWQAPALSENEDPRTGTDVCVKPGREGKQNECSIPVSAGLPTDAALYWIPSRGRRGPEVTTFDAFGAVVSPETFRIRPGRVVMTKPFFISNGLDLSKGPAQVAVTHSEAIASVDCGLSRCEVTEGAIALRNAPSVDTGVTVRVRFAPRVAMARGDSFETSVQQTLQILSCPLTMVEGTVVRDAESPAVVARLEPSCSHEPSSLVWRFNGVRVSVESVVKNPDGTYVLLRTPGTSEQQVTVTAASPRLEGTVVASTVAKTLPLPVPRASLELPGHGLISFIPINRAARLRVAGSGEHGRFVPLPIELAYSVSSDGGGYAVQGDPSAAGFVSLRFGYRVPSLPGELAAQNLAVFTERLQRAVREASVPANIGALVEFVCRRKDGSDQVIPPQTPHRIAYAMRSTCRIVIHRERLAHEDGVQEIVLKVEVSKPDGTVRPEGRIDQRMLLRPGAEPRVIPIQGATAQFDRVFVQISHVADESRYALSEDDRSGLPSAQWNAIVEGGVLRLYATATIPAGLYRVTAPSGQLLLNFGVLSRLVLLDDEGHERLVGIELGLMGMGLVPQSGNIVFPPTLAAVGGFGLRVPLGPGAAVGVQAWVAYEFRRDITRTLLPTEDPATTDNRVPSSRVSFVFGPSISIGNIGVNL